MTHLNNDTLNAYLDDALTPAARAEAAAHLQTCTACAAQLESLTALFASLDSLPDLPFARDLSPSVVAAIRPKPVARPVINPAMRVAVAFQLLVALVALAVAIPFARQALATLPPFNTFDFVNTTLQGLITSFQTVTALPNPAILIPANLTDLFAQLPALEISTAIIAICLAAITLLWFVGNSLLLRPGSRTQRS